MTGDAHDAIQIVMKADTEIAPKMLSMVVVDDGSVLSMVISFFFDLAIVLFDSLMS